jgi:hypothetical protein
MARKSIILLTAAMLVLSILACSQPTSQSPTDIVTPYAQTTAEPTTPPGDTPTAMPTAESPTESPTEPPPSSWLPAGTLALYATGSWDSRQIYALAPGPTSIDLGRTTPSNIALSRTGRWLAYANEPAPATGVVIANLEDGTTRTIPLTSDHTLYGLAFDRAETRLAFTELGSSTDTYTWAIVVVNLVDGSIAHFNDTFSFPPTDDTMLPGRPIGWTAAGDELLLDTFLPDTEGNWAGAWAVTLPSGAPPAALDALHSRVVIANGDYSTTPRLSPDATHLLYLNRDYAYTPAGYEPVGYDLAVNQLWSVSAGGDSVMLVNVTDGGALAQDASWSQGGPQVLFAQGNYAGDAFASLTLKVRDDAGAVHGVGSVPLPPGGDLQSIAWCLPDSALVVVTTADYDHQLHIVEFGGGSTLIASADYISVLGCVP